MTGLLGGSFDPPHNGHLALAAAARVQLALDELLVLVAMRPRHKEVETDAETRVRLAEAAFAGVAEVRRDEHSYTVDTLRELGGDPVFLLGADEFADFLAWRDPDEVLQLARLAVATRPGIDRDRLDLVLAQLDRPERVSFFELEPQPESSREIRSRVAAGESIDDMVPAAVATLIRELGLYTDPPVPRLH